MDRERQPPIGENDTIGYLPQFATVGWTASSGVASVGGPPPNLQHPALTRRRIPVDPNHSPPPSTSPAGVMRRPIGPSPPAYSALWPPPPVPPVASSRSDSLGASRLPLAPPPPPPERSSREGEQLHISFPTASFPPGGWPSPVVVLLFSSPHRRCASPPISACFHTTRTLFQAFADDKPGILGLDWPAAKMAKNDADPPHATLVGRLDRSCVR